MQVAAGRQQADAAHDAFVAVTVPSVAVVTVPAVAQ
jgi:hypothetical protein